MYVGCRVPIGASRICGFMKPVVYFNFKLFMIMRFKEPFFVHVKEVIFLYVNIKIFKFKLTTHI